MASSGKCGDNVTWTLSDAGVLTLSGTGETYDYTSANSAPFSDFTNLITSIIVGSGITRLGKFVLSVLLNVATVSLPNTLEIIGPYSLGSVGLSFVGDGGELRISIPEGVTTIEDHAFYGSPMTEVSLPSTLQTIGDSAFASSWHTSITIPASVISIGKDALGFKLTSIEVAAGNTAYCAEDGVLFNIQKTQLVAYPTMKEGTSYTVPDGVEKLCGHAFCGNEYLTYVELPDTLTYIGEHAFFNVALTAVDIPESVKTIGSYAFSGTSLTEVKLPEVFTRIEDGTFYKTGLTEISIPKWVYYIGQSAFEDTALTNVHIPKGVTEIGLNAFDCPTLVSITVDEANEKYFSVDGVLIGRYQYTSESGELHDGYSFEQYPDGNTREEYTVPKYVTILYNGEFSGAKCLKKVILAGMTTMYTGSIAGTSVETLEVKSKVPPILDKTDGSFRDLTSIIVPYGCVETYKAAEGWKDYADIIVEAEGFPLMQLIMGILSELNAGSAKEPIAYLYNGVRLPKLPEWDREAYPYAVIVHYNYSLMLKHVYVLYLMKDINIRGTDETTSGLPFEHMFYQAGDIKYRVEIINGKHVTEWGEPTELEESKSVSVGNIMWTNSDIVLAFDTEHGSAGTVKLTASEPVPVYE